MSWWRPSTKTALRKWTETELCQALCFKGLATIICARMLFMPALIDTPANDRDHVRW